MTEIYDLYDMKLLPFITSVLCQNVTLILWLEFFWRLYIKADI